MVATQEWTAYDQSVASMQTYLKSNFIPSIPSGFARVAVDAIDLLEMGGKPWEMVMGTDMAAMPDCAVEVPGGWKIPALTAIQIAHLDYSLSESAVASINSHYESDEIPQWWMEWEQ